MKIPYIDQNPDPETGQPRPRFVPGPTLRPLGFKRRNLRHDLEDAPDTEGEWYSLGEALDFSKTIIAEAKRRKKAKKTHIPRKPKNLDRSAIYTLENLFLDWQNPTVNPKFRDKISMDGKKKQKPLAPNTKKFYKQIVKQIEISCPDAWAAPVSSLDHQICHGIYDDIWVARGLASARATIATLSAAISWGMRRRRDKIMFDVNPAKDLGMTMPDPRVRVATIKEVLALIQAADDEGLPEIGDMITIAVWTGQRQADRLAMHEKGLINGRRYFKQSKTGAIVKIPDSPELSKRLKAATERRKKADIISPWVVLNEHSWQPFLPRWYVEKFYKVRAKAAEDMPSVADITDQDFRDTAVTWLAMAGVDIPGICAITGHQLESATRILRHYLDLNEEIADNAIAKMVEWYEEATK